MGFMDIFKRKSKVKSLPSATRIDENREKLSDAQKKDKDKKEIKNEIKVFSQKIGSDTEYAIKMGSDKGNINVGKMYIKTDKENPKESTNFKEIVREIDEAINQVKVARDKENLETAKQLAKNKLDNLSAKNIQFCLDESVVDYIDEYDIEEKVEYGKIDKLVDVVKDMSALEIIELGEQLSNRLDTLDSIKTPEDAYKDRFALINYMKSKEEIPENPIIDANIQSIENGKELDESTVLSIAKEMEQIKNEDGALYSAYLKLEEKRVLKQVFKVITEYSLSVPNPNMTEIREVNQAMSHIKEQIDTTKGGFSPEILDYIIKTIKKGDISAYTKHYKRGDSELYYKVKNEMNMMKGKDKESILEFLSARMECLGQLHYKGKSGETKTGRKTLRQFIETTDFKDENNKETKEFLYIIAQIEKEHIKTECMPAIEKYSKDKEKKETLGTKKSTFKDSIHYEVKHGKIEDTNNIEESRESRTEPEK